MLLLLLLYCCYCCCCCWCCCFPVSINFALHIVHIWIRCNDCCNTCDSSRTFIPMSVHLSVQCPNPPRNTRCCFIALPAHRSFHWRLLQFLHILMSSQLCEDFYLKAILHLPSQGWCSCCSSLPLVLFNTPLLHLWKSAGWRHLLSVQPPKACRCWPLDCKVIEEHIPLCHLL